MPYSRSILWASNNKLYRVKGRERGREEERRREREGESEREGLFSTRPWVRLIASKSLSTNPRNPRFT